MRNPDASPVEFVDLALLLLLLIRAAGPISVKHAAEYLDVASSTAHRLLSALAYRGFCLQDRDPALSARPGIQGRLVGGLHCPASPGTGARCAGTFASRGGGTVQLMVLRGGNIQFIDGIESASTLRVGMLLDTQMAAFVSAGGKVRNFLLSCRPWSGTTG